MNNHKITFIGGGNMSRAIIAGLIEDGYSQDKLCVTNRSADKLVYFSEQFGVAVNADNKAGAECADVLVLAVKPHFLREVCEELKDIIVAKKPLVISIAAGVEVATLQSWLSEGIDIIRAMPNTPAMIGAGSTALYAEPDANSELKNTAETIFQAVGLTVWIDDESHLHAVTALSGSGPAYIFLLMEAMQEAAQELGLDEDIAKLLTVQTTLGTARIALETDKALPSLRESVTSPKGTTQAALQVFENAKYRRLVAEAIKAAYDRSIEIAKEHQ